tara:strand:- start:256 stop:801 length:546 start_codon:yes stop_codon:yes gene_type:complete
MLRLSIIFFLSFFILNSYAGNREKIIEKLNNTSNLSFDFEQNINGKVEIGNCIIEYPKKIYCKYKKNNKILVSNGKSLVIKTISSYYLYPLKKTPLNLILDKNYLINKIYSLNEKIIDNSYINYTIKENESNIDIFFDINSLDLIGWQTTDIYQNNTLTLLYSVSKNQIIKRELFKLPAQN